MAGTDRRKQSLYFAERALAEIESEAARQDRSLSWIVQAAWRLARREIMSMPGANDGGPEGAKAPVPHDGGDEPSGC